MAGGADGWDLQVVHETMSGWLRDTIAKFTRRPGVVCVCTDKSEEHFSDLLSSVRPVLKTLHLDKYILNEEECTSIGKAGVWWYNDIAVVLAMKPPGVLQKTLGVFDEYKGQWWCEVAVKGIKMLSELYQERLVTEGEVKRMKGEGDVFARVVIVQCIKPSQVVTKTVDVLNRCGCKGQAKQLRALNELFTRHVLTAEGCSEVARKERQEHLLFLQEWQEQSEEWEDHLAQVLFTKPTNVWQEAVQVLEKHGCPVKLKTLNELFTRHLLAAEECSEVARKGRSEWKDHLAQVLSIKPAVVWQVAIQVLEKHGCPVKKKLKTLNELFTRHLLTAEESSEVARKRWRWEDHIARALLTKPAEVVQKAIQVLEEHGCRVSKELKLLSELYQERLVTEDEVKMMKGQGGDLSDRLLIVQRTKRPEVVAITANVLDKFRYNMSAQKLRAAAAASQSRLPLPEPPDIVASTIPPQTETAQPPYVVSVRDASTSMTFLPTPPAPHTADIVEALNHQLDAKWRLFGTFLRVDYQIMEAIETSKHSKPDDCMLDLLGKWSSKLAGTGTLPCTWQTIVEAVKKTGFGVIAENLALKHGVNL